MIAIVSAFRAVTTKADQAHIPFISGSISVIAGPRDHRNRLPLRSRWTSSDCRSRRTWSRRRRGRRQGGGRVPALNAVLAATGRAPIAVVVAGRSFHAVDADEAILSHLAHDRHQATPGHGIASCHSRAALSGGALHLVWVNRCRELVIGYRGALTPLRKSSRNRTHSFGTQFASLGRQEDQWRGDSQRSLLILSSAWRRRWLPR